MKALLKNYRQSPRKVRLVANLIRGKSVPAARQALTYLPKKSALAMLKLLNSAVANAREYGVAAEDLFVKTITVNKGLVMRRVTPMARGRAARYAKTFSIVALELGTHAALEKRASAPAKEVSQEEKETTTPKAKKTAVKKVAKKTSAKKAVKTA